MRSMTLHGGLLGVTPSRVARRAGLLRAARWLLAGTLVLVAVAYWQLFLFGVVLVLFTAGTFAGVISGDGPR